MLAFDDPLEDVLWLCRATPRDWLRDGGRISARGIPTRWGKVGVTIVSQVARGRVDVEVNLPDETRVPLTRLRLRLPAGLRIAGASVLGSESTAIEDGEPAAVDAESEAVSLPANRGGHLHLTVRVAHSVSVPGHVPGCVTRS